MIMSYVFDKPNKKWYAKWKCDIFDAIVDLPDATPAIEQLVDFQARVVKAAETDIAKVREALKTSQVEVVETAVEKRTFIHCEPIDWNTFKQALAFLDYCHKENKSEGMLLFRYVQKKWYLSCPEQWNSMGGVCYHPELHPEECTMVMGDIHSHPGFGSTHSSTDHADERKNTGIFLVVSDFHPVTCNATIHGRFKDNIFKIPPELILSDTPAKETLKEPFPPAWKKRVHKSPCKVCEKKREKDAKASKTTTMSGASDHGLTDYEHYGMPGYTGYGEPPWHQKGKSQRRSYDRFRDADYKAPGDGDDEEEETVDGDSVEDAITESYETWKKVRFTHDALKDNPRLFSCSNWGCREDIDHLLCSKCQKTVETEDIVKSVALMAKTVIDHVEEEDETETETETEAETAPDSPTVVGPKE